MCNCIMKKFSFSFFLLFLFSVQLYSQQLDEINEDGRKINKQKLEKKDYIPEVHGTVRAKYEYEPQINKHRFKVGNARVSIQGNVLAMCA